MSTNDPTPQPPNTGANSNAERPTADETTANTPLRLTVEEAQRDWTELIDYVITTRGPVHIASQTGGAGAVLMSNADYEAWQSLTQLQRIAESKTARAATEGDDTRD